MKEESIHQVRTRASSEISQIEEGLVLKVVRIKQDKPEGDLHTNPCDNCNPWTSCCDHFS